MKRTALLIAAAVVAIAALNALVFAKRLPTGAGDATKTAGEAAGAEGVAGAASRAAGDVVAAGPGRVEALSEEIRVATQIGGRLSEVLVDEGDAVAAGQVVARIENHEYVARVTQAEAELRLREAEARRVRNGAREQERREADATVSEAEAVRDNTQADLVRLRQLAADHVISQQELDRGEQAARVAQARVDATRQRASLVAANAREEDQARADADVALARARLAEARATLAKTDIVSPIDGVVLRRHRKTGESVSTQFDSPVLTVADRSRTRVRIDVDERDVASVSVGQPAFVTVEAFGDRRFPGSVVRVGQILGRKNFRTDEPSERVDTKILETLIELQDGHELPLGLRVQAFVTR